MKRLTLCLGLTTLTLAGFAAGRATAGADDGVTLVVRHTVANFDKWKTGYDGHEAERRKYGWTSATVLTDAVAANKPWDVMFRELMLPNQTDEKLKGAAEFLRGRVADTDKLTNDVSVAFFGVNVSCAQCHNHPLVADWTQDHFYGMKAFLARTLDNGGAVAERDVGLVKFKTTKNVEKHARLMFLSGQVVESTTVREPTAAEQK